LVVTLQRELQAAQQELDEARRRIAALARQRGGAPTAQVSQPFSLRAEEQRQEARGKRRRKRRRRSRGGRISTAEEIAQAVRTEKVFPTGVPRADCWLSHTRPVWRLEHGQAEVAGRCAVEAVGAAMGKGVRSAGRAAGELAGGP
jgi:hypothetical protein